MSLTLSHMEGIARTQGIATAAGCQLVASCDLAVAIDEVSFATPGGRSGWSGELAARMVLDASAPPDRAGR